MDKDIQLYYNIRLLGKPFCEIHPPFKIRRGYEFEGIKYYQREDKFVEKKMPSRDSETESIIILDHIWYGSVGFILAENVKTKKQVVRTGVPGRYCAKEEEDCSYILDRGYPLYVHQAVTFFPGKIRPEDYVLSSDGLQDWYVDANVDLSEQKAPSL